MALAPDMGFGWAGLVFVFASAATITKRGLRGPSQPASSFEIRALGKFSLYLFRYLTPSKCGATSSGRCRLAAPGSVTNELIGRARRAIVHDCFHDLLLLLLLLALQLNLSARSMANLARIQINLLKWANKPGL